MSDQHREHRDAVLWDSCDNHAVQCRLCQHRCRIAEGQLGLCRVRRNEAGRLVSLNYGALCATNVDPIEKKPLYHCLPGSLSFSIACLGCNFQCDFCQNWQISQWPRKQDRLGGEAAAPELIVEAAARQGCASIAYTYTEPTVFMELCADCGRLAHQRGLANVFVSNGYMTGEAVEFAAEFVDAINVDLKAFRESFYKQRCKATLAGVLESLRAMARRPELWLEVTTLIVPGQNDSDEELQDIAGFIAGELGSHVPWHLSRFHPQYDCQDIPPTPLATLERAWQHGRSAGLSYVYLGNVRDSGKEHTHCSGCGRVLIDRSGYRAGTNQLQPVGERTDEQDGGASGSGSYQGGYLGRCPDCGTLLHGVGDGRFGR